jgi:hypothetical protein
MIYCCFKNFFDGTPQGLVTKEGAINMVEPRHLEQLLHPLFANEKAYRGAKAVLGTGLAASPGAAVGRVVFTAEEAEAWEERGEKVRWGFGAHVCLPCIYFCLIPIRSSGFRSKTQSKHEAQGDSALRK